MQTRQPAPEVRTQATAQAIAMVLADCVQSACCGLLHCHFAIHPDSASLPRHSMAGEIPDCQIAKQKQGSLDNRRNGQCPI